MSDTAKADVAPTRDEQAIRNSRIAPALLARFDTVIEKLARASSCAGKADLAEKVFELSGRLKDGMATGLSTPTTFEKLVQIGELAAEACLAHPSACAELVPRFLAAGETELGWWHTHQQAERKHRERRMRMGGCAGSTVLVPIGVSLSEHWDGAGAVSMLGHAISAVGLVGTWWFAFLSMRPERDLLGRERPEWKQ